MVRISLSLQLNISSDRDKNHGMTDWIDEENAKRTAQEKEQERFWSIFPAVANRWWQALVIRIKQDAEKLNQTSRPAIKGEMRINGRELIPTEDTLYVDNLAFPALYLDIRLDVGARSIHIHQLRRESLEGRGRETDERLTLDLDTINDLAIKDSEGNSLSLEDASKYILRRFLNR